MRDNSGLFAEGPLCCAGQESLSRPDGAAQDKESAEKMDRAPYKKTAFFAEFFAEFFAAFFAEFLVDIAPTTHTMQVHAHKYHIVHHMSVKQVCRSHN